MGSSDAPAASAPAAPVPTRFVCSAARSCGGCRYVLPDGRCCLALAAAGERTEGEVAELLGVSRSLVGKIEVEALRKLRRNSVALAVAEDFEVVVTKSKARRARERRRALRMAAGAGR